MRVLIAGGPLCVRVCQLLAKDWHEILLLTDQTPAKLTVGVKALYWDGHSLDVWHKSLQSNCAIINLVGAGQPLCESHLEAAYAIKQALSDNGIVPDTLLQAASVAYYGDAGDDMLIEASPPGDDPQAAAAHEWESITADVDARQCWLRFGRILHRDTDLLALATAQPAWFSWAHVDDVARVIRFLLNDRVISGPVNVVSPYPTTYNHFSRALQSIAGYAPNHLSALPYPSQRVLPQTLMSLGFNFAYADAEDALRMLVL